MNAKIILIRARDLLTNGFCKGHMAEDVRHKAISHSDPKASFFCMLGALNRAAIDLGMRNWQKSDSDYMKAKNALYLIVGLNNISIANDSPETTKLQIISWLDQAITLLPST